MTTRVGTCWGPAERMPRRDGPHAGLTMHGVDLVCGSRYCHCCHQHYSGRLSLVPVADETPVGALSLCHEPTPC